MSKLIYIAEDESITRTYLKSIVEKEGYTVEAFETGDQLFIAFQRQPCDLVILDVIMPGNSGTVVCEMLRKTSDIPIIMLSALDSDEDYAAGILNGGNVYFSKPVNVTRLVVHINSLLNRPAVKVAPAATPASLKDENAVSFADVVVYPHQLTAYCNSSDLVLTNNEFNLLVYMVENSERAVSRDELLSNLWGSNDVTARATDDTVKRLRKKLSEANSRVSINTVWGYGFRLSMSTL